MEERILISSGSTFESEIGYSRAVVIGSWIFVSGTTGYNYTASPPTISPHITAQLTQCLLNIDTALKSAESSIADIVRVRYILRSAQMFPDCWPILREWFGDVRPAATMIQAGLMEEEMLIEVEVTARKRNGKQGAKDEEESGPM